MKFAFVDVEKANFPVDCMCRQLEVSRSGYYAWRKRPPPQRALDDDQLAEDTDWHAHGDLMFADRAGVYTEPTYLDIIAGLADGSVLVGERWLGGVLRDRWLLHRDYVDEFEHMDAGEEIRVRRPILLDAKSRSQSDVPA